MFLKILLKKNTRMTERGRSVISLFGRYYIFMLRCNADVGYHYCDRRIEN